LRSSSSAALGVLLSFTLSARAQVSERGEVTVPASVQHAESLAYEHFQRGVALTDAGDVRTALQEFQIAYDLVPSPAALVNVAELAWSTGDLIRAYRALDEYRSRYAALDEYAAQVSELQAKVDQSIALVVVRVVPSDAELTVDGVPVRPGVNAIPLLSGQHELQARRRGFVPGVQYVDVAAGARKTVELRLNAVEEAPATLRVTCSDSSTRVMIDGGAPRSIPAAGLLAELRAGVHRVKFSSATTPVAVRLEAGESSAIDCGRMSRARGETRKKGNVEALWAGSAFGVLSLGSVVLWGLTLRAHDRWRALDEQRVRADTVNDYAALVREQNGLREDARGLIWSASAATCLSLSSGVWLWSALRRGSKQADDRAPLD
jgi:hypothetical protein